MHSSDDQLVNVLGATSLVISDLLSESVRLSGGSSRSAAAALAVLRQSGPLNVTALGRRVGLSQPAAARMVDSLERTGLVRRSGLRDRARLVQLTTAGRRTAARILRDRSKLMTSLLDGLADHEQEQLRALLGRVLTNAYRHVGDPDVVCRLCDRAECVRTTPRCPVGVAAGEPPDG